MTIGIIGGTGWIGAALGRALLATETVEAQDLVILNRSGPREDYFGHKVQWARDCRDLVERSEVVVLSVRPQDWPGLDFAGQGRLVLSVMAGVPIAAIGPRTVRAIPNAAAEIGSSYSPWVAGPEVTRQERARIAAILSAIGREEELTEESQLDLMTAVPGAGPAYPALMAVAIMRYLTDQGLPRSVAEHAAEAVICDAARLLSGRMAEAEAMVQSYVDYAGTTAAGLLEAQRLGFDTALQEGFAAATRKAASLGG